MLNYSVTRLTLNPRSALERAEIIKAYSYHFPGTSANAAKALTQLAVELGYIEQRPAIYGETLKAWVMQQSTPAWAAKAAQHYLTVHQHRIDGCQ